MPTFYKQSEPEETLSGPQGTGEAELLQKSVEYAVQQGKTKKLTSNCRLTAFNQIKNQLTTADTGWKNLQLYYFMHVLAHRVYGRGV